MDINDSDRAEQEVAPPWAQAILILGIIIGGIGLLVSPWMLIVTIFMFDSPQAASNPITLALAAGWVAGPIVALILTIAGAVGLVAAARRRRAPARSAAYLQLLCAGAWCVYMAMTLAVLEIRCDGNFACDEGKGRMPDGPRPVGLEPSNANRTAPPALVVVGETHPSATKTASH